MIGLHGLDRAALAVAAVTVAIVGFERIDPSLGLTQDLRLTDLRAAALVTLALWLVSRCLSRRPPQIPHSLALPLTVWLGCLVVSAVLAPTYQTQALAFVRDLTLGVVFGWAVYDLSGSRHRQLLLIRLIAIGGLCVATIGLLEAASVRPVVDWLAGFRYQPTFSIGEIPRISSTLPHPNVAAMLLEMILPLLLVWLVTTRRRSIRIGAACGVGIELAALVLTLSRAGIIFMEVILALLLVIGWWQRQPVLTGISLCAVVGLPVLVGLLLAIEPVLRLHITGESVEGWYSAAYSTPAVVSAQAGEATTVPVHVANTGTRTWTAGGEHPFALSYHLNDADGTPVTFDGPRTPLPYDVQPGGSVDVQAQVIAPQKPGNYLLEWDEVQESVTWFSWNGAPSTRTYLTVEGPVAATVEHPISQTEPPAVVPPPPGRLTLWRIALRMARNRPLLGIGPDNFRWVYGDFAGVLHWDTGVHANSVYFEWLADTGVLGLGAFLWLAWRLLRESSKGLMLQWRSSARSSTWWMWRLALLASLVAWFLHGTLDYFYEPLPTNLAFWMIAGLALSAARPDTSLCA